MADHSSGISSLIPHTVNFAILTGGLVYLLRKPTRDFVKSRHHTLKEDLERVQKQLAEAQTLYNDYSARLASMDAEVAKLTQQARSEAEASKVRILTEAKRMADTLIVDAKRSSEAMMGEFKNQVRTELAAAVVDRAETLLKSRLTGDDRERIRKDFSKQVEIAR